MRETWSTVSRYSVLYMQVKIDRSDQASIGSCFFLETVCSRLKRI
jgi:hypothetical protein